MADVNVNANIRRFQNGGAIRIVSGSDTLVVLNVDSGQGSISWNIPGTITIAHTDRGVIQDPLKGEEQAIGLSIRLKAGALNTTNELRNLFRTDKASPDNKKRLFDITFRFPDYPGATTGTSIQFRKCVCDGMPYTSGGAGEWDTEEFQLMDHEVAPVYGTY